MDGKISFVGFDNLPGRQGKSRDALRDFVSEVRNPQANLFEQFAAGRSFVAFARLQPSAGGCPEGLTGQRPFLVIVSEQQDAPPAIEDEKT